MRGDIRLIGGIPPVPPPTRENPEPLGYKPSALTIELNSSKASAGKKLSLSRWCIASLYIYHFSCVSSRNNVPLG